MRRLRIVLVALAVGITTLVGVHPAKADVRTCTGVATLTTPPLYLPNFGPPASGRWTMTLVTGTCTPTSPMTASGTIAGDCILAGGSGTISGHDFTFIWFSGTMLWSGDAIGAWQSVAAVHMGHSCTAGSSEWYATGSMTTTT